jgi:carboxymethylenebutenolidase
MTRTKQRNDVVTSISMALATALVLGCGAPADEPQESSNDAAAAVQQVDTLPSAIWGRAAPPSGEAVSYFDGDEAAVGYLAVPEGDGPFPAVILIHEWNGLVDRIRQMADAMAAEGYVALAADLYSGRTGSNRDENVVLMQEAQGDIDRTIANLDAAARFLRERDDVTGRVASMGWCFGGGIALSYALGGEEHEGTAIFYGSLVTDPDILASIQHEVYGTFAEMDGGIPPENVNQFVEALRSAGVENDVHVYDAVNHGFWLRVEEDAELREAPALDAWRRLRAYLQRTLGD